MARTDWETGMYYDRDEAERAVNDLHGLGYGVDDVSVVMRDQDDARRFAGTTGSRVAEGAATGASIGGGLGAILAALTATGSVAAVVGTGGLAAPLVAGPLAAALAGLGAGGLAGGIVGALVGAGIPEDKAKEYQEGLNRGGVLLGVNPRDNDRDRVRSVFSQSSSYDRDTLATPTYSESFDPNRTPSTSATLGYGVNDRR